MPVMHVVLEQPPWPDLESRVDDVLHLGDDAQIHVAGLEGGMSSGKPSVAFRFDLPDGRIVLAETSLALLVVTTRALMARFGDPTEE